MCYFNVCPVLDVCKDDDNWTPVSEKMDQVWFGMSVLPALYQDLF